MTPRRRTNERDQSRGRPSAARDGGNLPAAAEFQPGQRWHADVDAHRVPGRDAAAAVSFLDRQPGVRAGKIAVLGESMGGEQALAAVGSDPCISCAAHVLDLRVQRA
jgi:dienelactone hydrolase